MDQILSNRHRRFAIVKLWPEVKTAEDECIARIKAAAESLGIECVEIHADGKLIESPNESIGYNNVDFVLHLHYDTPKFYDAFSIVALWNPISYYHEWGYHRTSRNLITHDDFISCDSQAADDQVARLVRHTETHMTAHFKLYHSTPSIVYPPSLGEYKLFYAGINWERIKGGRSRHQNVLKSLDSTGLLRIYGPKVFQGTEVWKDYKSYVKEIPFDGISIIDEISRSGISLVLSSPAHKDAGLMSNRLFESITAGALIICDENPWAKTHFGDSLLYIDCRCDTKKIMEDIKKHIAWAKEKPNEALDKIKQAQNIFKSGYNLTRNLKDLFAGLSERQADLENLQRPNGHQLSVCCYYLMLEYSEEILSNHMLSIDSQTYGNTSAVLVTNDDLKPSEQKNIDGLCAGRFEHVKVKNRCSVVSLGTEDKKSLGEILNYLIKQGINADTFVFIGPNERIMSNHIAVLAGALQRHPQSYCAATAAILISGDDQVRNISELIDFGHFDQANPTGIGRFIFRRSKLASDISCALPYLNHRAIAALVDGNEIEQQAAATIIIDKNIPFTTGYNQEVTENEILRDFNPDSLKMYFGFGPKPQLGEFKASNLPKSAESNLSRFCKTIVISFTEPDWVMRQIKMIQQQGLINRLRVLKSKVIQ